MTELNYQIMLLRDELCCVNKVACKPTYDGCKNCPRSCNLPYDNDMNLAMSLFNDMKQSEHVTGLWLDVYKDNPYLIVLEIGYSDDMLYKDSSYQDLAKSISEVYIYYREQINESGNN